MMRRGACPTLPAPMPTGDGLLARLPARRWRIDNLRALCRAAAAYGNGLLEITSRGSLQVRGLSEASAPALAASVDALGLEDLAPPPPLVVASPLAGLVGMPADAGALAAAIRAATAGLVLGPKVSVVLDAGGPLSLDDVPADIRLTAVADRPGKLHLAIAGRAGDATALGWIDTAIAPAMVASLLGRLGPDERLSTAHGHGPEAAHRDLPARRAVDPVGRHRLAGGLVAQGLAAMTGATMADDLDRLLHDAARLGVAEIETAPGHALLLIGPADAPLAEIGSWHGFLVNPADPRRALSACAGAPACASGHLPTRQLALALAPHLDGSVRLHLSGCAKRCAAPAAPDLLLTGHAAGADLYWRGQRRATASPDIIAADLARRADTARRRGLPLRALLDCSTFPGTSNLEP